MNVTKSKSRSKTAPTYTFLEHIDRCSMSWYIRIHDIKKVEVSWWEKILIPVNPYVIVVYYWDDEPFYSNNIPEKKKFFIEDDDYQDIVDWVVTHHPAADVSKLTFLSPDDFEYIKLKSN